MDIKNNLDEKVKNLHKKKGFLNTYKTLDNAVTYLKMLSTTQNYNMANRKYVKYNLRFTSVPAFEKKFFSLNRITHYSLFLAGH